MGGWRLVFLPARPTHMISLEGLPAGAVFEEGVQAIERAINAWRAGDTVPSVVVWIVSIAAADWAARDDVQTLGADPLEDGCRDA